MPNHDLFAVDFSLAPADFDYHVYGPSGEGEWWKVSPQPNFYGWDCAGAPADAWRVSGYSLPTAVVYDETWQATLRVRPNLVPSQEVEPC